eukprot:896649-Prymnesium_polylepis.1
MSPKYETGQLSWGDKKLAIVVLTNFAPVIKFLSTDRLQAHKINPDTFDMRKAKHIDNHLKALERERAKIDADEEAAIDRAEAGMEEEDEPTVE